MNKLKITDDYEFSNKCTDNKNEDIKIAIKFLLLSIPSGLLVLCLISLNIWTILKILTTNK